MKWKLLICGAAFVVTGCAFHHNPYSSFGEFGFTYDLVPPPVMGLDPEEAVRIMQAPVLTPEQRPSPALPMGDVVRPIAPQ